MLTVNDQSNNIFHNNLILIPQKLFETEQVQLHGHEGLVKTKKELLCEKVWFPTIDDSVNQKLGKCIARHANISGNHPDPLQVSLIVTRKLAHGSHGFLQCISYW